MIYFVHHVHTVHLVYLVYLSPFCSFCLFEKPLMHNLFVFSYLQVRMHKLNLQEVARLIGARCSKNALCCGVSVDSRLHQSDNLFFALSGAKTDGHQYLEEVALKGAAGAVVKNDYPGPDYGLTLIYVEDPLVALQNLAKNILQRSKARVIGVTGSLGKTTTKDFLTTILKEKYVVASSPGNSNSQIGLPLAILNHTDGYEDIVVLEMGMTHPGQIRKLIEIVPPECVIITSVALVHACNFNSLDEIVFAKAEILEHPNTKVAIVNRDIINYSKIEKVGTCRKISFAFNNPLADYSVHSQEIENLSVKFKDEIFHLGTFPVRGKHHQTNFMSVVACARYFDMDWDEITAGMGKLVLPALRGREVVKDGILFINDSYNAAELSVKAALENLPAPTQPGGRKIAVLADMLELGQFSEKAHNEIGNHALNFVDLMFCYGTECRHILDCWQKANRPVQWFLQREELIPALRAHMKTGDVVLIKGSRGTQILKLLDELEILPK